MARPSAVEILRCDWIQNANEVTEAEVVAAFERRRPVSEEAHNTMSVTCAPRLKNTEHAFDALMVRVSQSPNPASAIDHTRIRRDYYDQKGLFPIPRTMEYSIPFPIPHTNPGYTHGRETDTLLLFYRARSRCARWSGLGVTRRWKPRCTRTGKYFPITTFRRLIAHTRLTFIFLQSASGSPRRRCWARPASGPF